MMEDHRPLLPYAIAILTLGLAACSIGCARGGAPARNHRTKVAATQPVAAPRAAVGRAPARGVPWLASSNQRERAYLLERASQGLLIVARDGPVVRVLPSCRSELRYGVLPSAARREIVRLDSTEETSENAPEIVLEGRQPARRPVRSALVIESVLIARLTSVARVLGRWSLRGACQGATHFVEGADLALHDETAQCALELRAVSFRPRRAGPPLAARSCEFISPRSLAQGLRWNRR
jgi:hypothetical protein